MTTRAQAPGDQTEMVTEPGTCYRRTFHGRIDQVQQVRRDIARHLAENPDAADDAILIARELAANVITHSASAGEFFTIRCEIHTGYIWVECEDPHGLNIVEHWPGWTTGGQRPPATETALYGHGWTCPHKATQP